MCVAHRSSQAPLLPWCANGVRKEKEFAKRGAVFRRGCHPYPPAALCLCCRKLRATLDEYTTRVGQQAIVLCISPSKPNPVFKVFGAAPLENVVGVCRNICDNLFCSRQPAGQVQTPASRR